MIKKNIKPNLKFLRDLEANVNELNRANDTFKTQSSVNISESLHLNKSEISSIHKSSFLNKTNKTASSYNFLPDDSELNENFEDEENDVIENEIYLCLYYESSKVACCYYDLDKKTLFTMNDMHEGPDYEITNMLINDLNPKVIITCSRCGTNYISFLRVKCKFKLDDDPQENEEKLADAENYDEILNDDERLTNKSNLNDTESYLSEMIDSKKYSKREKQIEFFLLTSNEFKYEISRTRIMKLDEIEFMPTNLDQSEKIIFFSGIFDFESKLMVKSAGGLLKYLERNRVNFEFDYTKHQSPIYSIQPIRFDKLLLLDITTLKSLQIFNNVDYNCANKLIQKIDANNFRTSFNDKFNNTLYGLFSTKIQSKVGIKKLRSFLMRPIRDIEVLNGRQKIIGFFCDHRNHELVDLLGKSLKKCIFISQILKRMRITRCGLNEWKRLYKTSQAFIRILQLAEIIYERINNENSKSNYYENSSSSKSFVPKYHEFKMVFGNIQRQKGSNLIESQASHITTHSNLEGSNDECQTDDKSSVYYKTINENIFSRMILKQYAPKLDYLVNYIEKTIDFKKSNEEKKCRVLPNVSNILDEKNQILSSLTELLSRVANEESKNTNAVDCSVVYIPQLGFLLLIKEESFYKQEYTILDQILHSSQGSRAAVESASSQDQDGEEASEFDKLRFRFEFSNQLEFMFKSNNDYYYKNDRMKQLDSEIGDLNVDIADMETQILEKLQLELIKYSHYYADMIDICGELDCLLALALVAKEYNYVRPHIFPSKSFAYATNVRHPLIELNCENSNYIPNDILTGNIPFEFLNDEENSEINALFQSNACQTNNKIKVITGPNACGKTAYLKSCGLIIYMAMIGSYVPASKAYIGDFDRIFTRINSDETVSIQLSSFAIDTKQISDALNGSTNKSLILVDEFGKGTNFDDGEALVAALLKYWSQMTEHSSPHIYFSTHFYDILHTSTLIFEENQRNKMDFLTFEYYIDKHDQSLGNVATNELNIKSNDKLIYLFKLKKGIAISSHAISIAHRLDLNDSIVQRSVKFYDLIKRKMQQPQTEESNLEDQLLMLQTNSSQKLMTAYKELIKLFLNFHIKFDKREEEFEINKMNLEEIKAEESKSFLKDLNKIIKSLDF